MNKYGLPYGNRDIRYLGLTWNIRLCKLWDGVIGIFTIVRTKSLQTSGVT